MTELTAVTCDHGGVELVGQLALPAGPGPHPAVLVMHNAHGLGPQVRESAAALARLGYLAIATDMYGGGLFHQDPKTAGDSLTPLWRDPALLRARVVAWFEAVRARPESDPARIAAIGYCFGGQCVLELARSGADVKAVVSYHGILSTFARAEPGAIKGQVAVYTGTRDPYVPREHVEALRAEMEAAGARWQVTEFGEVWHSFTDPHAAEMPVPGVAYDRVAHQVSWAGTLALLSETLS